MGVEEAYAALGLVPGAGERAIRGAFRRLVLELHPDRAAETSDEPALRSVLAAYGVALRHARGGPTAAAAPKPAPRARERYVCPCCDDSFTFGDVCSRCGVTLHDELTSPVKRAEDARVAPFVADLEARGEPVPTALERNGPAIASWGLVGAGTLAMFVFTPVAAMFLGYGFVMMAMRAVKSA